jgi:hypothetical protein
MVQQGIKERRQFIRAKRVLAIEYRQPAHKGKKVNEWNLSTTEDMSLGGIKFFSDHEFRAGDLLEIRVVMSGVLDIYKGMVKIVRVEKKASSSFFVTAAQFLGPKKKISSHRRSAVKFTSIKKAKRL